MSSSPAWTLAAAPPWCPLVLRRWLPHARHPGSGVTCHRGHSLCGAAGELTHAEKIGTAQQNRGFTEKCGGSVLRNRVAEGIYHAGAVCQDRQRSEHRAVYDRKKEGNTEGSNHVTTSFALVGS
jgi:hypothetical protein